MTHAQRVLLLLLAVLLGAFGGRLMAHRVGDTFALPSPPDPQHWRIISAGLAEGIGRTGVGRVSHVAGGALNLATHVFIRPDMAIPQFQGDASRVILELAEDSGPLWLQVGPPPGKFIQLQPGAVGAGVDGQRLTRMDGVRQFQVQIEGDQLKIEGGGQVVVAGQARPGPLELSAVGEWARVRRIQAFDVSGNALFQQDFRSMRVSSHVLGGFTLLGALVGLAVGLLLRIVSPWRLFGVLGLLSPLVWTLSRGRDTWLHAVERLYLDAVAPSQLSSLVLGLSACPVVMAGMISALSALRRGSVPALRGFGVWAGLGALCLLIQTPQTPLVWGTVAMYGISALICAGRRSVGPWWTIDGLGWVLWLVFAPNAALFAAARVISVVSLAGMWVRHGPRAGLALLGFGLTLMPVGVEAWARDTSLDTAWRLERITGERANERGWERPTPGWTGRCGEPGQRTTHIVVGGGSSVGGAYQFSGEPEAFFTAVAHQTLCEELAPGQALVTHNFGDGDRNTFTISRTIDEHLSEADILVLYVGVNDLLTRQNSLTRKERETRARARLTSLDGPLGWVAQSRLAIGTMLWFKGAERDRGESVPDVPLVDARENHQRIIDAARARGVQVVLMTEYTQETQRALMLPYYQMQSSLAAEDVHVVDVKAVFEGVSDAESLADRNHLSRAGNRRLGEQLARALQPLLGGSSR